jgi:hypothetical protein
MALAPSSVRSLCPQLSWPNIRFSADQLIRADGGTGPLVQPLVHVTLTQSPGTRRKSTARARRAGRALTRTGLKVSIESTDMKGGDS